MAIHSDNNEQQAAEAQQAAPAPSFNPSGATQTAYAPAPAQARQAPWTFGGPRLTGPIAYSQGSDALARLREKLADQFKDTKNTGLDVAILALDNQQIDGIYYSSVVLCMRTVDSKVNGVAFYTMMLTGTRDAPASKTETILGQTTEIKVVPGEAFDDVYVQRVTRVVAEAYPGVQLYNVGGTTVPADFNTEDPQAIHRLVYNASAAVFSELRARQPDFQDISVAMARNDTSLQVNITFGRETIDNSVSEPMRSDVDVAFVTAAVGSNQNESLNNQTRRSDKFGKVVGFIDSVWSPVQPQMSAWGGYQDPMMAMQATQKYAARMVITHMESTQVSTLSAHLLLLLSVLPVGIGNTWYHAFYNQHRFNEKKNAHDLTDVGALNYEANLPSAKLPTGNTNGVGNMIDTRAKDFTPEVFGAYMRRLFRDGMMFALDVPLCGPQTWYLDVFRAAAKGNPEAQQAIIGAANALTNGAFQSVFDQTNGYKSIFADNGSVVHLGYYEGEDGRKRDIRDIDHLAVLNVFGDTDISVVRKWSDSFLLDSRPIHQRLADRWSIIQAVTKSRAVLTGTAERLTFSDHFLQSLNRAAGSAGLNVKTNTPVSQLMNNVERGVATYVNNALVPNNIGAVFHQAGAQMPAGMTSYGTRQYSRYG